MTYIKKEDAMMLVQKMMKDNSNVWKEWETIHKTQILEKVLCEIPSLPSIDPQEMINEYLQDIKDNLKKGTNTNLEFTDLIAQKNIIELLLNKLPK